MNFRTCLKIRFSFHLHICILPNGTSLYFRCIVGMNNRLCFVNVSTPFSMRAKSCRIFWMMQLFLIWRKNSYPKWLVRTTMVIYQWSNAFRMRLNHLFIASLIILSIVLSLVFIDFFWNAQTLDLMIISLMVDNTRRD